MPNCGNSTPKRSSKGKWLRLGRSRRRFVTRWPFSTGRSRLAKSSATKRRSSSNASRQCSRTSGKLRSRKRSRMLSSASCSIASATWSSLHTTPQKSSLESRLLRWSVVVTSSCSMLLSNAREPLKTLRLKKDWLAATRSKSCRSTIRTSNLTKKPMRGCLRI